MQRELEGRESWRVDEGVKGRMVVKRISMKMKDMSTG